MIGAELKALRKSFGGTDVLKGIDLKIEPRQFTVLLGPSGCGKSTTLRLIAGLEMASAGEIWIGDRNVSDLEPRERDIAMVFQNYALYPNMTVARNIGFGLMARKLPRAEIDARVAEAARMLDITELLGRKPKQLSGGQQQRVAIGRAIVRKPNLFLFDEPLSNLDTKLRIDMRTELLRLHRELNATTIYVTHDQEEAMTMADRIIVMDDGRIAQIGPPGEIYHRPQNLMVAGFIGSPSMNFFEGRVTETGLETQLGIVQAAPPAGNGRAVVLGVRPDDLSFPENLSEDQTAATLEVTVEIVELLGARGIVTMRTKGLQIKGVFDERLLPRFEEGTSLTLALAKDRLHLFDAESGRRLA